MSIQEQETTKTRRRRKAEPVDTMAPAKTFTPLQQVMGELAGLQRQRKFCINMQGRLNRSTEAFLANDLGYKNEMDGKDRKRLFARAAKMREAAETFFEKSTKGKALPLPRFDDPKEQAVFTKDYDLIQHSWEGRLGFDAFRAQIEKRMVECAKLLPGASIVEEIHGLGYKGFAIIAAECYGEYLNGMDDYASPAKVFKRMGVALIGEERQRKKADPEEAEKHGYNPRRRAELFGAIGDPLFRTQSTIDGPYRQLYDRRRAHTAVTHADWTDGHSHNDAKRYMEKKLLTAIWRAWRKETGQPVHAGAGRRRAAIKSVPQQAMALLPPAAPKRTAKKGRAA